MMKQLSLFEKEKEEQFNLSICDIADSCTSHGRCSH